MSLVTKAPGVQIDYTQGFFSTNDPLSFGEAYQTNLMWDTYDANANCLKVNLPAGGAVEVPVLALGIDLLARDLGYWNGRTEPLAAIVDADRDSWVGLGFSGDDAAILTVGGSAYMQLALGGTIPATADHTAGIDGVSAAYNDYGTLVSSQTYRAAYFRYNVRSTTPSNPTCEVTGVEGVAGSYINDEAITFRGGYFRTYINADATSSMRTNVGIEISARASYSGGTECVAEGGTAFVGARIWMAPYFTSGSIGNINNFHALWILNEATDRVVTNAIKIDATTYGSGFSYCLYTDAGKFYQQLDGAVAGSGLEAADSSAAGSDIMYVRAEDYRTLTSAGEYRGGYFRYNVRSTTPSNPTCEVTGIEGVAGSYIADEAITFRGGYFRTYINADATSTMRTAVGCEISARASYSGGTLCVAEGGTAFVGARIWMAPFFTDASITNINNFHALWILNEAAGKTVTNAIKIDSTTYGSGFTYCFYTDSGLYYQSLDGNVAGSGLVAAASSATGTDVMYVRAEDYRTLTSSQTYRGAYVRYNVRSATAGNPTCEVTGIEGVAGSYIADEAITFRGGYFRTYTNADATATMRTAVGCEISARASYSGGTECVAEGGTAFIGARIWMAPYFTDASISNINNSHALWIINETPNTLWAKYIDRAITIDATTYGAGFNYNFYTDTGKFYMRLNGATAGSGLVATERSTATGDDWMTVQIDDYRTLTSAQVYNAGYFRYNVRATTPGSPQCEVTGAEIVGATYVADGNLLSLRGAHIRTYINAGATASAKTSVGCDVSARAGYYTGTDCVALAGTCFTGLRVWMAPYFTSGSLANINNFWGIWVYGEHATQRNGDAAVYISDAGGGWVDGLRVTGTFTGAAVHVTGNIRIESGGELQWNFDPYFPGIYYSAATTLKIQLANANEIVFNSNGTKNFTFQNTTYIDRAALAGVTGGLYYDIKITTGGAANAVVFHQFMLDSVIEAGLLGETDGSGSYTQGKTGWKVPYRDSGANVTVPVNPTTAATWLGCLRVESGNDGDRIYAYANEGWKYAAVVAGFTWLPTEPTTFGDYNGKWKFGDVVVMKVDKHFSDGAPHALPYPFEKALNEVLDSVPKFSSLAERVAALEEAKRILSEKIETLKGSAA